MPKGEDFDTRSHRSYDLNWAGVGQETMTYKITDYWQSIPVDESWTNSLDEVKRVVPGVLEDLYDCVVTIQLRCCDECPEQILIEQAKANPNDVVEFLGALSHGNHRKVYS